MDVPTPIGRGPWAVPSDLDVLPGVRRAEELTAAEPATGEDAAERPLFAARCCSPACARHGAVLRARSAARPSRQTFALYSGRLRISDAGAVPIKDDMTSMVYE